MYQQSRLRKLMGNVAWYISALLLVMGTLLGESKAAEQAAAAFPDGPGKASARFWLESSLKRVFPGSKPGSTNLTLLAARNSKVSFQACFRHDRVAMLKVSCSVVDAEKLKPQVRLVGFVPMDHLTPNTEVEELEGAAEGHLPGLVPDVLWPRTEVTTGIQESRSFWITLRVPADMEPGEHELQVRFSFMDGTQQVSLPVKLKESELVVQPRRDFHVIHWWRGEATWDYYKTGMFDERWYEITRAQLENMLDHGSDVAYVPLIFKRREEFKRPCQLLIVNEPEPGRYEFDWTRVKEFTDMCKEIGFERFEWPHMWIYWGVENPMRVYKEENGEFKMLWPPDISGFSDTYLNYLRQFLPDFHEFLVKEKLLEKSYFHLSDEPGPGQHLVNYKRAREILREMAPWMKVMDALSDVEYGKQGLTDIPIPVVSSAQGYIDAKIPHWVYYCCGPQGRFLNRFMDTPLAKIRMSGMLFYRLKAQGFLHWGYNYWHKMESEVMGDPFNDGSNALWPYIPYGDPFVVYPGPDGQPLDSIRWEVFAESLQDYAILQTAGIKPEDPLLAEIKTYADFPKNPEWVRKTIAKILKLESPLQ